MISVGDSTSLGCCTWQGMNPQATLGHGGKVYILRSYGLQVIVPHSLLISLRELKDPNGCSHAILPSSRYGVRPHGLPYRDRTLGDHTLPPPARASTRTLAFMVIIRLCYTKKNMLRQRKSLLLMGAITRSHSDPTNRAAVQNVVEAARHRLS